MLRVLLLVVVFSVTSLTSHASGNNPPNLRTYARKIKVLKNSENFEELRTAANLLLKFPSKELYETAVSGLRKVLEINLENAAEVEVNNTLLRSVVLLGVLNDIGSLKDIDLVNDLILWAETLKGHVKQHHMKIFIEIRDGLAAQMGSLNLRPYKDFHSRLTAASSTPTPLAITHVRETDPGTALEQVKSFYQRMSDRVKNQEPILRSLQTLFLKDLMRDGQRNKPEVFYYMGLPGNGKDTIAEAYVDSMWNYEGAFVEHMFRMNIRKQDEMWSYIGSPTGYKGSGKIPLFLKFLVNHSGGKYIIKQLKDEKGEIVGEVIESNPKFISRNLPGYFPPSKAVIFINEAHNIPRAVKDNMLKQAIERGIFPINNPGPTPNSVSEIVLPVTFKFASNEGISLLEPREINGSRAGAPLSLERLLENYNRVYNDKDALKRAILEANGGINSPSSSNAPGTSEEFINRIPSHHLHLLKPLDVESLENIFRITLDSETQILADLEGPFGSFKLSLSDELVNFVVNYKSIPSENARPLNSRLESFVLSQIYQAILNEQIKVSSSATSLEIGLVKAEDGVVSIEFKVSDEGEEPYSFSRVLEETLSDRILEPLSDERIQEILAMRDGINSNVAGVEHIVDQLVEAALVSESESRNAGESSRPATVMAFLGKSSTGKTETARQWVKTRYGDDAEANVIDFNTIRSLEALQAKVLGSYNERKESIPSDFMKAYDRAPDGEITFIFDEAANAPKELLKGLYEILREPVATGFSDGKPRPMKNVTVIMTGNAGEEIYQNIPTNLPADAQEKALHEVYKIFIEDEDLQKRILSRTFPDALIARLGKNIFHFGPLTHAAKRRVAQIKLIKGLEFLREKPSERGWDLVFKSEADLLNIFEMIEREGFNHHDQGASIDKFVRESLIDKFKASLITRGVPSGQTVVIEVVEEPIEKDLNGVTKKYRQINLITEDGGSIDLEIAVGLKRVLLNQRLEDRILVAYHEVGHELVSEVFFGDQVRPKFLSIIEGVSIINGELVHYAGLRAGENSSTSAITKEFVIRKAAVLAGGYVAQRLLTLGARHDAGKNNDQHRATQLIQEAILRYGLSDEWGFRSIPSSVTIEDYIQKELSDSDKDRLHAITDRWLDEARRMAKEALLINSEELFGNMSRSLSSKGYLDKEEIEGMYERDGLLTERNQKDFEARIAEINEVFELINTALQGQEVSFAQRFNESNFSFETADVAYNYLIKRARGLVLNAFSFDKPWERLSPFQQHVARFHLSSKVGFKSRDAQLSSQEWIPEEVADTRQLFLRQVYDETSQATEQSRFSFVNEDPQVLSCKQILVN